MTSIILVRHGETEWNIGEIFRGRIDVDLNETGEKQAALLAKYLADVKLAAIYASPLKRTVKTAQKIADYQNIDINIAPELVDLDYGEWQGLSNELVKEKYKTLHSEWLINPQMVTMPGGENLEEVRKRAFNLVNKITTGKDKHNVALVTHRVVNKVLICAMLGLDNSHFWNIKIDTCGISTFFCEDGKFILDKHNDTSFLKPLGSPALSDF